MSNSNRRRVAAALVVGLALAPLSSWSKLLEDTVAVVNGAPILLSEYQKELSTSMDYWSRAEPDALKDPANLKKLKETTLEELINREILYQEGVKQKIKVRERDIENGIAEIKQRFAPENARELPEAEAQAKAEEMLKKQLETEGVTMAQFRERLSKQIMARKLIDENVRAVMKEPEEKEVKAYFDKVVGYMNSKSTDAPKGMDEESTMAFMHIAERIQAMSSERLRVFRVLKKISPNAGATEKKNALEAAQQWRKELIEGKTTFAELARAKSEDPDSAPRGGDIGYVLKKVVPPDFWEAANKLPLGEISDPIPTEIGYHIIRVTEKRIAQAPDFEQFREELSKFLLSMEFQKQLEKYVQSLKSKAVIERSLQAAQ